MTCSGELYHLTFNHYAVFWFWKKAQTKRSITISCMCLGDGWINITTVSIFRVVTMRLEDFYAVGFSVLKLMSISSHLPHHWVSDGFWKARTTVQEWSYIIPAAWNTQNFDDVHFSQWLVTTNEKIGRILQPDVGNNGARNTVLSMCMKRQAVKQLA